ncbi:penicillin-binding protein 1C [Abyssalbus ytuae]|uniref:peptidoglycan glycosyltransferase n=1 Tax=Abyssalbus ytuae TaxID=2926907 RepID=A0A9E6ZRG3_9FLAO|nr:penicillin-binding protein 1C [Abyssalbus ytuae]UOB19200.1 penicillin-binding protein 1C [Abyssalbus ytuae]
MKKVFLYLKKHKLPFCIVILLFVIYYFSLPDKLFNDPASTVIESKEGKLLGAMIAGDGQWRFPSLDSVPEKFKQCILNYEDKYFYSHPGFNPVSIIKALKQNIQAGKIVRGGSTLTQQVIRLSRKGKERTYLEKIIEIILATRLELREAKEEILKLYASHAPFGGNVVGLDVASWRYFGVQPSRLSWAESATLAVLPNSPSLIYPGKNQEILLKKRNDLLLKIFNNKIIDSLTYQLALAEELPQKPFPLPQHAPHFLQRLIKSEGEGKRLKTTINYSAQKNINNIIERHYNVLKQNQVFNAGVIVMEVETRNVIAYVGNTPTDIVHQKFVDVASAPRSTGSVLKPLLYAAMLDAGEVLPNSLVADVPTYIAGYSPENYTKQYDGAVKAKRALARSLNVPAVRMLKSYGLERFREEIKKFNLEDLNKSADYYGLTLIVGGAESNLWDLCKTYASIASTVNHFNSTSSEYYTNEYIEPVVLKNPPVNFGSKTPEKRVFGAGSIYLTLDAMKEVNRPEGNEAWEFFDSSKQIAWKTGTSFGNRDAWAIGITKKYVAGVWVGNADGEGRPNLTGVGSAAPILFDVFDILPDSNWFSMPYDDLIEVDICKNSGYLASDICPKQKMYVPLNGKHSEVCPYHQLIHLDKNKQFRVNSSCENINNITTSSWFVLPPLMEYYYKTTNAAYKTLPPFKKGCFSEDIPAMDFIYPKTDGRVVLTKGFEGITNEVVLKIVHTKPNSTVFWYIDDDFIGQTTTFHEMAVIPDPGNHLITVVDEYGNEIKRILNIETTS